MSGMRARRGYVDLVGEFLPGFYKRSRCYHPGTRAAELANTDASTFARRRASASSLVAMIDGTARHTPAAAEPETEEREDAGIEPALEAESDADVPHYSPAPQPVAEPSSVGSSRPAPRKLLLDEPPEPGCGGAASAPALNLSLIHI